MLKPYQKEIELGTLYELSRSASNGGSEQLQPNIEVVGGTVDIYGSQEAPSTLPGTMSLARSNFSGIDAFGVIPNFLYIEQNTGTTTSIIISGVGAKEASTA